jgi:hypothetical protein
MADVEKLQNFKGRINDLCDASTLLTWKSLFTQFVEMYKEEMLESFVGTQGQLDTKRTNINNAATTLLNLLDLETSQVKK